MLPIAADSRTGFRQAPFVVVWRGVDCDRDDHAGAGKAT